ncbi:stalk domain-containing protein [Paenibacillus koleovorans]|uniref:stalk domain-containing protein n=1 Tax=Paenibacillus koleovorans TaxID=121608 RepID=UPI000FD7E8BD|nr:stalk domain-containing protein [Paenibacillus koleovorans]
MAVVTPTQKKSKKSKVTTTLALTALMLLQSIWTPTPTAQAAEPAESPVKLISEEPITSGAILKRYEYQFDRGNKPVKVNANVVEVDLKNPLVRLDTMAGTNGQFTKKQTVREMANETGAVAGINGDFYNTQAEGVPMGPQIMNNKVLATPPYLPGFFTFALTRDNKPVVDLFTFQGQVTASNGASYPLGGVNKTYYWYEDDGMHEGGKHAYIDGLYMYTNTWGQIERSNDGVTVPTEILVQNGIVKQIALSGVINQVAPVDGYILRAAGKADEFVRKNIKVGDKIQSDYKMFAQDFSKSYDVASFKMMIGGGSILVEDGKVASYSREASGVDGYSYRSRTAMGYSKDERYAYLITVENAGESKGMSLPELQQFMIKIGVWKGLNLDGGGSTQLITRPLGEFNNVLTSVTEYGGTYERRVVNGVGVYSNAPKGEVKEIALKGATTLFLNEKATYSLKAYDIYYNPVDLGSQNTAQTIWSTSQPIGTFNGNTFTALQPGQTTLTVKSGQASKQLDVEIIGKNQLASLKVQPSSQALLPNAIYKLPVVAMTKSGITRTVPPELIKWQIEGFKGQIEGDKLTVQSIDAGTKQGRLYAQYDGFTTMVAMTVVQQQTLLDFEAAASTPIAFTGFPAEVAGTAKRYSAPGMPSGAYGLSLAYDFTKGTGTKAAYAAFGTNGTGIAVPGQPTALSLKVKGDNSFNWVRAEIIDAAGQSKLIDLTQYMNWTDWKTLTADLKTYNVTYPITLKRVYVANPLNGQDERAAKGEVLFDDIAFQYANPITTPRNYVKLKINEKSLTVNQSTIVLDQAPVIYKDNTVVPVRFVVEAMGGQLTWNDQERKVTILKDDHYAEMWLDNPNLIMDGTVVTAEVAPLLMNERTMVPLRLLSEKMGWKVGWDAATYSVTLE